MARPVEQSLADLEVMAEAVERIPHVLFAKKFFEKKYQDAKMRVVADLGDVGSMLDTVLCDEHERPALIQALRSQFLD